MAHAIDRRSILAAGSGLVLSAGMAGRVLAAARPGYDPAAKFEVTVTEVEYRKGVNGRSLMARIYQPMGKGPFPVIMDLHGGAWNAKNRTSEEPFDRALAASGLLVVAVDMTLAPEAPYPACVQDANFAVRWLKANAQRWGGQPDRFGVFGSSSGGHVAELLVMRPHDARYNAFPLDGSPKIDATVAYAFMRSPVSDTFARYENAQAMKNGVMVKNNTTFFAPMETIHESNPYEIVLRKEKYERKPMLIMQGALDTNVRPESQARFVSAFRAAGGQCDMKLFAGCEHEWIAKPGPQTDLAHETAKAFVARQLKA